MKEKPTNAGITITYYLTEIPLPKSQLINPWC